MKKRIALLCLIAIIAVPAFAYRVYLVKEWYKGVDRMCEYDNGTILNRGSRLCPISIESN